MHFAAAGNTEVPAYLALVERGYQVMCSRDGDASKNDDEFSVDGPLPLLGQVALVEQRGAQWPATDAEIDAFMTRFKAHFR